jgi:hypothetical protein
MCRGIAIAVILVMAASSYAHSEYEELLAELAPIHWWRLNDAVTPPTSQANDSINGLHGTWYGNGPTLTQGICDPEDFAVEFWPVGGPTWLVFNHSDSLLLTEGTISFCMLDTSKVLDTGIISKDANGYGTGGHLTLGTNAGATPTEGRLFVRLQSDTTSYYLYSNTILQDVVYHVTFTFGPEGMKLYIDGVLVDENPYIGGLLGNLEPMVFGASSARSNALSLDPLSNFFSGILDEVLIFDYALKPDQVVALYRRQIPEPTSLTALACASFALLGRRRRLA